MNLFFRPLMLFLLEWSLSKTKHLKTTFSVLIIFTVHVFPVRGQHFDNLNRYISQIVANAGSSGGKQYAYYLVKPQKGAAISAIESRNIRVIRPLSKDLFIVMAVPGALDKNRALFREARPVNNLWKLEYGLWGADRTSIREFTVKVISENDINGILASLPSVRVVARRDNLILMSASLEDIINHVIVLDEVIYAGMESTIPHEESRVLDLYLSPNTVNKVHNSYPLINGAGSVISIRELKYDQNDVDLQGRHVESGLASAETSTHATEMATIAAGAGNSFINGRGVAWNARLTSSDFDDLFPDDDEDYTRLEAWVQNHAYGTVIENFYGALAEAYDESANRLPELLHVFSSGNEGTATGTGAYGSLEGIANLTGNFKMSKNTLSVGAVDTLNQPVFFSSRGPAYDGRLKPEVVAYSTQGSSNAAALVSGVVSLLQQVYREKENKLPASALVKAMLINSAKDAGSKGVDFITGYGNVDAYRSVVNMLNANYFSGNVTQGEKVIFELDIPENTSNLKVTLVWNDPASAVNAPVALVNDLDMKLDNGEIWLPWVLDPSADKEKLLLPAQRNRDHLNNTEQITIETPQAGVYTITIEGSEIAQGPQEFYVAYQWDTLNQLRWMFPTASDNMPFDGETGTYFFWESTLSVPYARLEYTTDEGTTWHTIAESVDLSKGRYRWNDVPQLTTIAQARFVTESDTYPTEAFTISRPARISIGFNCSDSVMLQWRSMAGAIEYEIQNFSDALMKPFAVTADTFIILNKSEVPAPYFAIQPVLNQNKKALRSPLIDHGLLGGGCFLHSFVSEVLPQEGIYLNIELGTNYGVEEIVIEHEANGIFESIGVVMPATTNIRFLHDTPAQGQNRYRLRIMLTNGQEVLSEVVEDYFLTELPFLVFPNPVSRSGELGIFSKIFDVQDVTFRLYRADGVLVFTTHLLSEREFVSMNNLAPGLYTCSFTSEEGRFVGRIVVKD